MMTCNPNFVVREIFGKVLLMPIRRNEIGNEPIHLNDVAAVIWKHADSCKTKEDLQKAISSLYGLEPDSAEQVAVTQFINELIEVKLISE